MRSFEQFSREVAKVNKAGLSVAEVIEGQRRALAAMTTTAELLAHWADLKRRGLL